MKRVVCIWLPDWPVTVWRRGQPSPALSNGRPEASGGEPPFALVERGAKGLRLLALNAAARRAGLRAGQAHADATAMVPHLVSEPAAPERDLEALRRRVQRQQPQALGPPLDQGEGRFAAASLRPPVR